MKEIEKVSIGGYAFTLEKDASQEAADYLCGLEAHYLKEPGGKEIMEGIEERMAELLVDRCGTGGVATVEDIRAIIEIIGRPERIEADDPAPEAPRPAQKKKLFRNPANSRLGGVCSGLAAYFDIEVTWMRLIFAVVAIVVFFTGVEHGVWSLSVPLLYCILWVAMPAARTSQDRWAMKGESGNLNDIRNNVTGGIREMGQAAREMARNSTIRNIFRILIVIIGFMLLITGTSGLASVSVVSLKWPSLFGARINEFLGDLSREAPGLMDLISTPWVLVLAILAVVLPLIGMIYGGVQLIFDFKPPRWRPGLVIFVLWLIIVIVLLVLAVAGAISTELISI